MDLEVGCADLVREPGRAAAPTWCARRDPRELVVRDLWWPSPLRSPAASPAQSSPT
jgi:hypothetical protein